jgi:hypothetical protein
MNDYVVYFDRLQDGKAVSCRLAPEFGSNAPMPPDVTISAAFPDTCSGNKDPAFGGAALPEGTQLPATWIDIVGAVNPVMFAVPPSSNQHVVSAEAAYRVYGFGSGSSPFGKTVDPWTDEAFIFKRTSSSGTQQAVARTLGIPPDALRGVDSTGSSAMRKAFAQSSNIERTIGISTSEVVDVQRTAMRSLAYQHYGQPVAFYPDSDPGLFDRRNIRDGHYFMWIPLHVFGRVNAGGDIVAAQNEDLQTTLVPNHPRTKAQRDADVKQLVFVIANRQAPPVPNVDLFGALKLLGNVPTCAMQVTRTRDGADLTPLKPPTSCGCAFEAASPGAAPPECKRCTQPADCTGTTRTTCSFGFCE